MMIPKQNVVFTSYYSNPAKVENDYQADCITNKISFATAVCFLGLSL